MFGGYNYTIKLQYVNLNVTVYGRHEIIMKKKKQIEQRLKI